MAGDIQEVLKTGTRQEKIRLVESLCISSIKEEILLLVSAFDDADIQVRGEAFSSLVFNPNDISGTLIECLNHPSKYVRAFVALVLANRHDKNAVSQIAGLVDDPSALVRSCAVGALGFLKASNQAGAIRKCLSDADIEVRKSAIKSAIDIGDRDLVECLGKLEKEDDPEIKNLLAMAKKIVDKGGPGGI